MNSHAVVLEVCCDEVMGFPIERFNVRPLKEHGIASMIRLNGNRAGRLSTTDSGRAPEVLPAVFRLLVFQDLVAGTRNRLDLLLTG